MYDNVLDLYQHLRTKYGKVYITVFPDEIVIPWKPLNLNDYFHYMREMRESKIPFVLLEDEIFRKCVLDNIFIREFHTLKAGIVSVVAQNIVSFSGPINITDFNTDLENNRLLLQQDSSITELVVLLTMAFPYTPEQVYAMDYETFLQRVAEAELKLMYMGIIKDPITIQPKEEAFNRSKKQQKRIPRKGIQKELEDENQISLDAKQLWEKQQGIESKPSKILDENKVFAAPIREEDFSKIDRSKWWKESPALESKQKNKIDFTTERAMINRSMPGGEQLEKQVAEHQLIQDAQIIYKDLFNALDKKKSNK